MNQNRRMLVLCPYPQGVAAGQRLKYEQYFDDWRAAGWDITVSSFMDRPMWEVIWSEGNLVAKAMGTARGHLRRLFDMLRVWRYDLVYVFMWVTPFGTSVLERLTRAQARALIYDVEDNILIQQEAAAKKARDLIARLFKAPGKARYLIRTSDHVITSSPFLNDQCLQINAKRACTYISSSVDTERFRPAKRHSDDGPLVIGWTGTFSSKMYLDILRGVFQRLALKLPFQLMVIGNFDYELPGVDLEVVRWTAEREVEDLQMFDIGVYPLPIDDWVLGKSGLKAIQYMAFGLPCVATEVGTTPQLIRDGENGLLVRSEAEWEDALERLARDPELRQRLGKAARADAVARYSLEAIAGLYRGVIDQVAA